MCLWNESREAKAEKQKHYWSMWKNKKIIEISEKNYD